MDSPVTKQCGQCGAVHPASNDYFGTDNSQADSLRKICKQCYSENRYGDKAKAVEALRLHDKIVAKAKRELKDNLANLSPGQIEKYERIVRLDGEHRAEFQKKILDARKAQEDAQRLAAAAPSLKLVQQHFGSPIFLTIDEMRLSLEKARLALGNLTDESDGPARVHVEKYIERVAYTVKQHDEREAELARDAQESLNEKVCRRVIGRVHDQYLGQVRAANTAEAKIALREQIRARKKAMLAMAKTATGTDKSGAERAVVAKAVADALEKLALMLYAGTNDPLPTDTLENLQSRIDSEAANAEFMERAEAERRQYWDDLRQSNPEQFEKESRSLVRQIKGDDHFARMQRDAARRLVRQDPVEAARIALLALKPRNVEQPNIIWVLQEGKREIWYWPMGALVKRDGSEVVYDARMKAWFLAPAPAGAQLDSLSAKPVKQEWYQDEFDADEDGPKWKQRPEDSGTYEQMNNGEWRKVGGESPWTRPEKITFRRAEPPASAAHSEFRHGKWYTQAEIDKAVAAEAANPPNLLPPLPRHAVADSLALPPRDTAADRAKDSQIPYVWARHEQAEKERKAREAALLKGEEVAL